ncbi:hypothetical protein [Caballeronia sp. GAWG1-5s-s]|uniref:hypothetical protein n=1 Tax=Caballeronia sp. GAWG1-5s-s TaxID=2921743 RepID=UPI00202849AA|nr:hypothetical protein [Caballeronia sp. GAWG1-5s-s]
MRHTVIGVFDTYAQAEDARSALVTAGFARGDIELQANPKRDDAAQPSSLSDAETHAQPGVLANIERFFSMLFGGRDQPPEVAHYSEAVRRGAVLVAVDTPSEAQADIARTTLTDCGAIDIDERAASWSTLSQGATATPPTTADDRDHSILDELGLGRGSGVPGRDPVNPPRADVPRARAYPRSDAPVADPVAPPIVDPLAGPLGDPLLDPIGEPRTPAGGGIGSETGAEAFTRTDPATLTSRDYVTDPADDPLMPATRPQRGTPEPSTTQYEQVETKPASTPQGQAQAQTQTDPLTGVHVDPNTDWRSIDTIEPLSTLDEPAKPQQLNMQNQVQSQSMPAMGAAGDPIGTSAASQAAVPLGPRTVPNEYMEYEEDFRADYATKYATTGEPYEDYESAYRYGATLGNDERFRNRAWDDQMEYEMRRDWESRHPEGDTWDRFKAAIRHGWDRVTGQHHA